MELDQEAWDGVAEAIILGHGNVVRTKNGDKSSSKNLNHHDDIS